jgi:two-component system, response regulator
MNIRGLPIVLIAEDDLGDRLLLQEAFQTSGIKVDLRLVANGEEFLDYLYRRPPWDKAERPDLILLDLNMPRLNGLEALREIKANPALKAIPVVVLTTSRNRLDIQEAYASGANTYLVKPRTFEELAAAVRTLCDFWFKICALPPD